MVSLCYLGLDLCGHAGMIHGGLLATMLDEGMARCGAAALPSRMIGVTASLTVNYRKPVKAGSYVVLKAEVTRSEGRKVWVKSRIETLEPGVEPGKLLAEAEALFVEPKYAKVRCPGRKPAVFLSFELMSPTVIASIVAGCAREAYRRTAMKHCSTKNLPT